MSDPRPSSPAPSSTTLPHHPPLDHPHFFYDSFTVLTFRPTDVDYPLNWSRWRKARTVTLMCLYLFLAAFGSSTWAAAEAGFREEFGVGKSVSALGLSFFVGGFGVGPFLFGPLTEVPSWGRKKPWILSFCLYTIFTIPTAFANNAPVILLFRFLAGTAASGQLNNGGGLVTDLYEGRDRLAVLAWYGLCAWGGPVLAPFFTGLLAAKAGWQWPLRMLFILLAVACPTLPLLEETSSSAILYARAKAFRKQTGRTDILSPDQVEDMERVKSGEKWGKKERAAVVFGRPMRMLFTEPIAFGLTFFISFLYATLYLFFETFPIVFHEHHGIPSSIVGIVFFGVGVGMALAVATLQFVARTGYSFAFLKRLQHRSAVAEGADVEKQKTIEAGSDQEKSSEENDLPEDRLQLGAIVGPLACVSLFVFAWTSGEESGTGGLVGAIIAAAGFGYSIVIAFTITANYLSEVYSFYVVSSLAASCIMRSLLAAALPVVAAPMMHNLGTQWGVSLLGFIALVLIPVPVGLLMYGESFRLRSKMAKEGQDAMERSLKRKEELERAVDDSVEGPSEKEVDGKRTTKIDTR